MWNKKKFDKFEPPKCKHKPHKLEEFDIGNMPPGVHYFIIHCLNLECGTILIKEVKTKGGK